MQEKRKGISPILATVLLIVFTVSAAGLLYSWYRGLHSDTTFQAESSSKVTVQCSRQGVHISRVYALGPEKNITKVEVQSVGSSAVTVKDVLVSTLGTEQPCDLATSDIIIQPGQFSTFSGTCHVTCNTLDTVRIATGCGSATAATTGNETVAGCS